MPELEKAKLQPVRADRQNTPTDDEIEVQFNPTSLRLKLTNQTEGGRSRGRQRRQHTGASSTVLTLDLVFDSADETSGDEANPQPVSVRQKTGMVEQFVVPKQDGSETPPRIKFSWNELVIIGIVENVNIDFDLFAPNGVPLRAKVGLSIKEQEPKYQFLESGGGARNNSGTQGAGRNTGTQPGAGTNDTIRPAAGSNRSAPALENETAPEFAARQGLDPAAWRGLDVELSAGLTLEAGLEVGFSAGLNVNAGVGVTAGFQAGAELSLKAAVGLEAGVGTGGKAAAAVSAGSAAGFALSSAGGISSAIETVKKIESQVAAEKTQQAFNAPGSEAAASAAGPPPQITAGRESAALVALVQPVQARTPLVQTGLRSYSERMAADPAPPGPTADPRAHSYGFGVPLRPIVKTVVEQTQPRVCTIERIQARRAEGQPEFRKDPTVAPWIQLPKYDRGRTRADAAQLKKRPHPCGILYSGKRKGGGRR
jgi:hypothetical protein